MLWNHRASKHQSVLDRLIIMADALAIPLLDACNSLVEPQLGDLLLFFSTPQEMQRLTFATAAVREVFREAKDGEGLGLEALGDQLDKLTYVAYEVGDLLQEWRARAVRFEREGIKEHTPSRIDQVAHFLLHHLVCSQPKLQKSMPTPTLDDFYNIINQVENLGGNVKEMKQMLEATCKERVEFSIHEEIRSARSNAFSDESEIVLGRARDQDMLVHLLLNEEDHHAGQGLPLVILQGVEGVGKTTLAQSVLNDQRVQQHFDFKLWVHVSDVLDEKMVCKAIAMSAAGADPTNDDDEWATVLNVNKLFQGKKYLLVLDDVRKGNPESWGRLMLPLGGGGAEGAKILVTTRNATVAELALGSAQIHRLEPLLEEDCWALLQHLSSQRAGSHEELQELEELGREIARKCRGIPLIGRKIGGLMRRRTRSQWELILNSKGWDLPDMMNSTTLVELEVSYYNLPAHLRQFFSFWALSPNNRAMTESTSVQYRSPDYKSIQKDLLVDLWMAQGYISDKGHSDQMEEVGVACVSNLLRLGRSLFKGFIDNKESASSLLIKDIVSHDHANGCYTLKEEATQQEIPTTVSHVLVDCGNSSAMKIILTAMLKATNLRTTVFFGPYLQRVPKQFFERMSCLRALDLRDTGIREIPDSIGNLKLLRYLNLSGTLIKCLPEQVSSLYLMQTMKMEGCWKLQALPKDLGKLAELRHLEIRQTPMLRHLPEKLGSLTCLRTLPKFTVGNGPREGIAELQLLNQLLGELRLENLERVKNADEARAAGLDRKSRLTELQFIYNRIKGGDEILYEHVLEVLKPPCTNLRRIQIDNYMGNSLPLWLEGLLFPSLVDISLSGCHNCKILPAFGSTERYPKLETLTLSSMLSLEELQWSRGSEEAGLACLTSLKITKCPKLRIVHCQGMLPGTLKKLELCINAEETELLLITPPSVVSLTLHFSYSSHRWKGPFPDKVPNLKHLRVIGRAPDELLIRALPQFTSQPTLVFANCYDMVTLPDGFSYLTSVKEVVLEDCFHLIEEKCRPGGSEYHKICKIPTLHIRSRPYDPF